MFDLVARLREYALDNVVDLAVSLVAVVMIGALIVGFAGLTEDMVDAQTSGLSVSTETVCYSNGSDCVAGISVEEIPADARAVRLTAVPENGTVYSETLREPDFIVMGAALSHSSKYGDLTLGDYVHISLVYETGELEHVRSVQIDE